MYNFILQIALMVSLGVIIYLFARAVPRVNDEVTASNRRNILAEWVSSLPLHKLDTAFSNFLEKFLRRVRLILMRLENSVAGYLTEVRKSNSAKSRNGEARSTLFSKNGNGNGGGSISADGKNSDS